MSALDSALAARASRGTHAVFATRLLSIVCTAASITLLARLIAPADFGIWAIAALPLGLMTLPREVGLMSSIVQANTLTAEQQDAYFWASLAASALAVGLLALAAPLIAHLYDAPLVQPVLWVCCVSLALGGLGLVHIALLRRALEYDKLVIVEGGGIVCALIAGVAGAFLWGNVWALVAGHLASAAWMCASAWILCRWLPGRPRRLALADRSFSLQLVGSNLLTFAANSVGLLVGFRFAAAELGFFNRGQQLFNLANFAFLTPITEVGFALLCRLRSEAAYVHAYVAIARRVWVLFIPYAVVLPLVSADLVRALLGPAWDPAAPILAWFAPAVFAQAFAALFAQLMMSQGRGRELRNVAAADLAVRTAGAILGTPFGIAGMAAGFSLATLLVSVPLRAWVSRRRGAVRLRDQAAALWPGLALAAAALAGALIGSSLAARVPLDTGALHLVFIAGASGLGWAGACLVLRPAREALLGKGLAHA